MAQRRRTRRYERLVRRQQGLRGLLLRRAAASADDVGRGLDRRLRLSPALRAQLNKVFPDQWSFMLGEIALYSFIVLVLTGTYLTLWFTPSMTERVYDGSYIPLRGVKMSDAYSSTLQLSFDVRGGLVIRQLHHWAALLFVAAMVVHMSRIFFTGAFRKPRDINWLIGWSLLALGIVEGFAGYSLPDDLLSGTGLRIAASIMLSIPVIGTYLMFLVFGGQYPGDEIIGRLYIAHVLLIPGLIAALVAAHLALIVRQKHTEFPAPGRTERTVSGERLFPTYAAKSAGFFFLLAGTLAALGGLVQINPVWFWGPYNPAQVSSGSQPDWYMLFLEGSMRLFPSWEIRAFGHTVPTLFWPDVVLPAVLGLLALTYPWVEARLTHDRAHHNLLQRPRDVPVRTGLGVMALTFYVVLGLAGADDIIAEVFALPLDGVVWAFRIGLLILPPITYTVAYRICLHLEFTDRDVLEEGIETGVVVRTPTGDYLELHQPLAAHSLPYAGTPVPKRINHVRGAPLRRVYGFFYPVEEDPPVDEVVQEWEAAGTDRTEAGR